jgi:hypothetical protein
MKSIINGFRYDTEKAILIGKDSASCSVTDFNYWESALYKTPKKGSYFLAGSGGPMSRYSKTVGQNQWTGGSKIEPMDRESAFKWSQSHLNESTTEEEFGDLIEEA